jgi:hypothetical protein
MIFAIVFLVITQFVLAWKYLLLKEDYDNLEQKTSSIQ